MSKYTLAEVQNQKDSGSDKKFLSGGFFDSWCRPIDQHNPVKKQVSILDWLKERKTKELKQKNWENRNLEHGDVFIDTFNVPHINFQQYIFIEDNEENRQRLIEMGFEYHVKDYGQPCQNYAFSYELQNTKYNLVLSLYQPKAEGIIRDAVAIAQAVPDVNADESGRLIFANAMKVLLKE